MLWHRRKKNIAFQIQGRNINKFDYISLELEHDYTCNWTYLCICVYVLQPNVRVLIIGKIS